MLNNWFKYLKQYLKNIFTFPPQGSEKLPVSNDLGTDNLEDVCIDCQDGCDNEHCEDCGKELTEEDRQDREDFEDNHPLNRSRASIHFHLLDDNDIFIFCDFTPDEMEQEYGEMLHRITSGQVVASIIEILMNHKEEIPELAKTVDNILQNWYNIKTEEDNEPIISPSSVFKAPMMPMMRQMGDTMGEMDDMD